MNKTVLSVITVAILLVILAISSHTTKVAVISSVKKSPVVAPQVTTEVTKTIDSTPIAKTIVRTSIVHVVKKKKIHKPRKIVMSVTQAENLMHENQSGFQESDTLSIVADSLADSIKATVALIPSDTTVDVIVAIEKHDTVSESEINPDTVQVVSTTTISTPETQKQDRFESQNSTIPSMTFTADGLDSLDYSDTAFHSDGPSFRDTITPKPTVDTSKDAGIYMNRAYKKMLRRCKKKTIILEEFTSLIVGQEFYKFDKYNYLPLYMCNTWQGIKESILLTTVDKNLLLKNKSNVINTHKGVVIIDVGPEKIESITFHRRLWASFDYTNAIQIFFPWNNLASK